MNQFYRRVAAIDIGTNSFHAVIVEISPDGTYTVLDTYKELVGLGGDVSRFEIGRDTMNLAVHAMKNIKLLCVHQQVDFILAYATSAVRESKNGGDFIQRVIDETGIKIQAIPGKREAQLIGIAVQHSIFLDEDPVLIMDIGGGSVEFIICNRTTQFYLDSFKMGVSRSAAVYIQNDPITKTEFENLTEFYKKQLEPLLLAINTYKPTLLIGSSGTMENIANMIAMSQTKNETLSLNQFRYSKKELDKLSKEFVGLTKAERLNYPGLDTKRVDFIIPGIILAQLVCSLTGIEDLSTSTYALREGMIIDYVQSNKSNFSIIAEFPDIRERSIFQLLRKCNWHEKHSSHVSKLALKLFDDLSAYHDLTQEDRELLHFACLVHDIGYHISHTAHHKHAMYIILNAELKGFNQDEIAILAHVSRYHRRSTPKKRHQEYMALEKNVRKRINKISAFLRVADGLDRSHFQNIIDLKATIKDDMIHIELESQNDPQVEIWGALRKRELFEALFNKRIVIS